MTASFGGWKRLIHFHQGQVEKRFVLTHIQRKVSRPRRDESERRRASPSLAGRNGPCAALTAAQHPGHGRPLAARVINGSALFYLPICFARARVVARYQDALPTPVTQSIKRPMDGRAPAARDAYRVSCTTKELAASVTHNRLIARGAAFIRGSHLKRAGPSSPL